MIELTNLKKQRNTLALGPISATFPNDSITLVVGENSGGKSSLLKVLAGVIDADTGSVLYDGLEMDVYKQSHTIGYMPDTIPFPTRLSIYNLREIFQDIYPSWDHKKYVSLLKDYGIKDTQKLFELSKGYQKMFMLAVLEASNATVIIMDEPTNGLDARHLNRFKDFLNRMTSKNCVVVVASNDINAYEDIASSCLLLHQGNVQLHAEIDDLLVSYRLWRGSKEDYDRLDKDIVLSCKVLDKHIECLVKAPYGEITNLETILIHLRKETVYESIY